MYLTMLGFGFLLYFFLLFVELRTTKFLSPFILIASAYFFYYIFRSSMIYLNIDLMKPSFDAHHFNEYYVAYALGVFNVGFVAMFCGYKLLRLRTNVAYKIGVRLDSIAPQKLFSINFIMYAVWLSITFYKLLNGMTHYAGEFSVGERTSFGLPYIVSLIKTVFEFSFFFIVYLYFQYSIYTKLFVFTVVSKVAIAVISGGALGLINIFLAFLVVYFWSEFFGLIKIKRFRISPSRIVLFGVTATLFLFVCYFIKEFARAAITLGLSFSDVLANLHVFSEILSRLDIYHVLIRLSDRFHGIDSLAVIISAIDNEKIEYSYGYMFYLLLSGLVPRFILHDKPDTSMGQWFTETLWNPDLALTGYQSTALFIPGDLYLNYGVLGVVIGMFFYGLFLKLLYRSFFNSSYKAFAFVFVSSSLFYFIVYEYTFASWILQLLRTFLLLVLYSLVVKFICRIRLIS